ncbi:hypothetical protein OMAG_000224 [Candidatus Omnitrophus magneticus]|uniref:Uncharacterized protein n=1 Tax=Candidatus Omnitrophus magneticus TaxID=1609969 RepID=A0A0F0CRK4_9BACT|nr:hypothetical protein OMAG_000224 [Candidatus Omnitrophus magneticus]
MVKDANPPAGSGAVNENSGEETSQTTEGKETKEGNSNVSNVETGTSHGTTMGASLEAWMSHLGVAVPKLSIEESSAALVAANLPNFIGITLTVEGETHVSEGAVSTTLAGMPEAASDKLKSEDDYGRIALSTNVSVDTAEVSLTVLGGLSISDSDNGNSELSVNESSASSRASSSASSSASTDQNSNALSALAGQNSNASSTSSASSAGQNANMSSNNAKTNGDEALAEGVNNTDLVQDGDDNTQMNNLDGDVSGGPALDAAGGVDSNADNSSQDSNSEVVKATVSNGLGRGSDGQKSRTPRTEKLPNGMVITKGPRRQKVDQRVPNTSKIATEAKGEGEKNLRNLDSKEKHSSEDASLGQDIKVMSIRASSVANGDDLPKPNNETAKLQKVIVTQY